MKNVAPSNGPALMCVINYPANSGFAWRYLEELAGAVCSLASARRFSGIVAYPRMAGEPHALIPYAASSLELDMRPLGGILSTIRQALHLHRLGVRVLYFVEQGAYNWRFLLYRLAGVRRVIAHYHQAGGGGPPRGLVRLLKAARSALPWYGADRIICVSRFVARRHHDVAGTPWHKIVTVLNGVHPSPEPDVVAGQRVEVRRELGIPAGATVFVCAARAAREKGIDHLLVAFDSMLKEVSLLETELHLIFVGDGVDMESFRALRETLPARDRIHFPGFAREVGRFFAAADICVHYPTCEEAFGLAVAEAMSHGLPVIASISGGIPELVTDGVEGVMVPRGNPLALTGAMVKLASDPVLRNGMSGRARARSEDFTFLRWAREVAGVVLDT